MTVFYRNVYIGLLGLVLACLQSCKGSHNDTAVCWTSVEFIPYYSAYRSFMQCVEGDPEMWIDDPDLRAKSTIRIFSTDTAMPFNYALGFNVPDKMLFYSNMRYNAIEVIPFEISDVMLSQSGSKFYRPEEVQVFDGTSIETRGVAVDWLSGTIYWTDAIYNHIAAGVKRPGEQYMYLKRVMVKTGFEEPYGIAVYPDKGLMFWTDYGAVPKIESAWLSGTNRQVIVRDDLVEPRGITIDYTEDRIYWVDASDTPSISSCIVDGTGRRQDVQLPLDARPYGIDFYLQWIFLTETMNDTIWMIDTESTAADVYRSFPAGGSTTFWPWDVKVFDSSRQMPGESACSEMACEHFCANEPQGAVCLCADGYTQANGTCIRDNFEKPIFIFAVEGVVCACHVNFAHNNRNPDNNIKCFLRGYGAMEALAVYPGADVLFYSDVFLKKIFRIDIDLTRTQLSTQGKLIAANRGRVLGLAVNYQDNVLYWTDEVFNHIMISDLEGRFQQVLIPEVAKPRNIELLLSDQQMFWTSASGIYMASLSGENVQKLDFLPANDPHGLTLHHYRNWLMWSNNYKTGGVYYWDLTTNRTTQIKLYGSGHVINARDLTTYEDHLIWSYGNQNLSFTDLMGEAFDRVGHNKKLRFVNGKSSHDVLTLDLPKKYEPSACEINNGNCSQLCIPLTNITVMCLCGVGYRLDQDQVSCVSDTVTSDFLLVADLAQKQLYQLSPAAGSDPQAVGGHGFEAPELLAYDEMDQMLTWVDYDSEDQLFYLNKARLDGMRRLTPTILPDKPDSLLVNQGRTYLTFSKNNTIFEVSGQQLVLLVKATTSLFTTMVYVDKGSGRLYWAENGSVIIKYMDLNSEPAGAPQTLQSLDLGLKFIGLIVTGDDTDIFMWTANTIHRVNIATTTKNIVLTDTRTITNVAWLGCKLYVTFRNERAIFSILVNGSGSLEKVTGDSFSEISFMSSFGSNTTLSALGCGDFPVVPSTSSSTMPPSTTATTMASSSTAPVTLTNPTTTIITTTTARTTAPAAAPVSKSAGGGLSGGGVAGVVIIVLLIIAAGVIIVGLLILRLRKKAQNSSTNNAHENRLYARFENDNAEEGGGVVNFPIEGLPSYGEEEPPQYTERDDVPFPELDHNAFGNPLYAHPGLKEDANANSMVGVRQEEQKVVPPDTDNAAASAYVFELPNSKESES